MCAVCVAEKLAPQRLIVVSPLRTVLVISSLPRGSLPTRFILRVLYYYYERIFGNFYTPRRKVQNSCLPGRVKCFGQLQAWPSSKQSQGNLFKWATGMVTPESEVTLLGIILDSKFDFNSHITKICKEASKRLNWMHFAEYPSI